MVVYNLMFPGGGQDYQVRVENNGGVNTLEIAPNRGGGPYGTVPYGQPYQGGPGGTVPYGQPYQGGPGGPYPVPVPTPGRPSGYPNAPVLIPNGPVPFDQVPNPADLVEPPRRPGPSRYAQVSAGPTFIGESDPSGGLDFAPSLVTRVGLSSWYDLDDTWYAAGRFAYDNYTIVDKQAADSRHHRDEFDFKLGGGYTLPWDFARIAVGLGYSYQQVSVANNRPQSLSSPRLWAPSRGYHGPTLNGTAGYVIAPALRADLDLEAKPGIFVVGDDTVTPLAPMFGYGAALGISWRPAKPVVVRAAYRYDFFTGYRNDFSHTAHGPELSLDWRF
jgi:opacity protein-like surface antigen